MTLDRVLQCSPNCMPREIVDEKLKILRHIFHSFLKRFHLFTLQLFVTLKSSYLILSKEKTLL